MKSLSGHREPNGESCVDDETEAAPGEEIEAQKEPVMTDNIATNEMDEAFVNEGEAKDADAAVKVISAELENRTDTKGVEGIWQNSLSVEVTDGVPGDRPETVVNISWLDALAIRQVRTLTHAARDVLQARVAGLGERPSERREENTQKVEIHCEAA